MPLRRPHDGETQNQFMSYCMDELAGTDKDHSQMVAICLRQFRRGPEDKSREKFAATVNKVADFIAKQGEET